MCVRMQYVCMHACLPAWLPLCMYVYACMYVCPSRQLRVPDIIPACFACVLRSVATFWGSNKTHASQSLCYGLVGVVTFIMSSLGNDRGVHNCLEPCSSVARAVHEIPPLGSMYIMVL